MKFISEKKSIWSLSGVLLAFLLVFSLDAADAVAKKNAADKHTAAAADKSSDKQLADAKSEYSAQDMLKKGMAFLESRQEDRAVKLLVSIPQMYPQTKAAPKADIVLGDYYIDKKQFDQAVKSLTRAELSDDPEIQAEAAYKIGIAYYNMNDFNKAFLSLRKVNNKFPGSVYANEASYYIGLCHFRLNRWAQALEALEKVGTSVPFSDISSGKDVFAEAGQRIFVKVQDDDLIVLYGGSLKVLLTNTNGDSETIDLEPLGKDGASYIGSIPTLLGAPVPNDKILQCKGGDEITVTYVDSQTSDGKQNKKVLSKVKLVSTASVGFTDGAFQEYSNGVFADQEFFMRVRDLDMDLSPAKDTVKVKVSSMYPDEEKKNALAVSNAAPAEQPMKLRDSVQFVLTETAARSGIFTGIGTTKTIDKDTKIPPPSAAARPLFVDKDDIIVLEYLDEKSLGASDPVVRTYKTNLLSGGMKDVKIEHRVVNDPEIRAQKNLIEAKILLQLGTIFKDVGLTDQSFEKAASGIVKVDDILTSKTRSSLDRSIVEDAFSTKWELLIIQDKMNEAVQVCTTLIRLYPDSPLVDRALMRIADAKIKAGTPASISEGLNVYRGIIQLPKSAMKAEAQYRIAEISDSILSEKVMAKRKEDPAYKPDYSPVIREYKKCADTYPDSPFAGQSLEKIVDFYIDTNDYQRVIELMDQIFRDYPDADFLDKMLLKWTLAAIKLNQIDVAKEKCEKLLSEYPSSLSAKKALQIKQMLEKRSEVK